ncbi:MAG: transporter substrate-binding domain-containing protein [Aeromonadaceae bacterium]|nr:transporter substrate-binding domain-containing protein [Aeromonadaceae bacterium]
MNRYRRLTLLLLLVLATPLWAMPLEQAPRIIKGDLEQLLDERVLRVLVAYDNAYYFLNQGMQDGLSVQQARAFEKWLNKRYFQGQKLKLNVVFIPVRSDQLFSMLAEGEGDLVIANSTVTASRRALVDFSEPVYQGIQEWLVSGRSIRPLTRLSELSGKRVWVRRSASYYDSLLQLNKQLAAQGLAPVYIETVDESLQDVDLMQQVSEGRLPYTVVDSQKAALWQGTFNNLTVHKAVSLRENGELAWAFRKQSPQLAAAVNDFLQNYRQGTRQGEALFRRYLAQPAQLARRHAASNPDDLGWRDGRYARYAPLFQKYADEYDFDWLLLLAQAYQESNLDSDARSSQGAVGLMQVMPATARHLKVSNIGSAENNILAGAKYLAQLRDEFFTDPDMDDLNRYFFTLAAYNAGPNRIAGLRAEAAKQGLDPNVWFDNVEQLAASRIGSETVRYVTDITLRYVAYRRSYQLMQERRLAQRQ